MKHLYGILAGVVIAGNIAFAAYWVSINRPQPSQPPVQVSVSQPEPEKPKGRIRDDVRYNSEIGKYEWKIDGVWKECRFEDALLREGDVIGIYPAH